MYRVDIVTSGETGFKVKSKDYEFIVDTRGSGITPPDTFLASLGTCIGVYVHKYAQGSGLELPEFNISVAAEFSKETPVCFKNINVTLDFKGKQFDERRKKALLDFIENCPVHNTLKANPKVEIKII